jgi:membrane protease YdiL (CAAX protease family)
MDDQSSFGSIASQPALKRSAMNDPLLLGRRWITCCGLIIALLSAPVFAAFYRGITGENHSNLQLLTRELGFLVLVILLLWIVRTQEKLPFSSIGLQAGKPMRSILRGLVLTVMALIVTVGSYFLLRAFGIQLGGTGSNSFQPSPWMATLIALRAGVAEEIFYRGYAIERLQSLTGNKWLAALVPLVIFAAAHYRQGPGGIVAVLVLGGLLTIFYLKFRDLIANIIGHFLEDFVLNVILPLLSGH